MRIFILDDDRNRLDTFRQLLVGNDIDMAESVEQAQKVSNPPYDMVFLDHDLGGRVFVDSLDPNTGYSFLLTPEGKATVKGSTVIVHSLNAPGAHRMAILAKEDGADIVKVIPYTTLVKNLKG